MTTAQKYMLLYGGRGNALVMSSIQGATNSQVFLVLRMSVGKSVVINWGDGKTTNVSATTNTTYTSNYSLKNQTFPITITGNLEGILRFESQSSTVNVGNFTSISLLTGLLEFKLNTVNCLSLNINNFVVGLQELTLISVPNTLGSATRLTSLVTFNVSNMTTSAITVDITNLNNLTYLQIATGGLVGTGSITGKALTLLSIQGYNLGNNANLTFTGSFSGMTLTSLIVTATNCILSGSLYASQTQVYVNSNNVTITGTLPSTLTSCTIISSNATISGSIPTGLIGAFQLTGAGITVTGAIPSGVITLGISGNNMFGGTFNISSCTGLVFMTVNNTSITSISNPISTAIFSSYIVTNCNLSTLDISSIANIRGILAGSNNTNLTTLTLPSTLTAPFTIINFSNCALTKASVDDIFLKLDTYYSGHTPTSNLSITLTGGTNAHPTNGLLNTDIVNLSAIFTAAGKFLSININ